MTAAAAQTVTFAQIDSQPLNRRQKGLITAAVVGTALEFFDYFIVAFILVVISKPWGLTFGQSALVLLASGVGAIFGAFAFGALADRFGRRPMFLATVLTFSLATGAMALIPDGGWQLFGILRFVVGFGVGGLAAVDVPLVQEFVPSHRRGLLGGLVVVFIPIGLLLGSAAAAFLGPVIGWRGLVLLGLLPALLTLYVRSVVPESPTWLIRRGRREDAKKSLSWVLGIPVEKVILPEVSGRPATKWTDMFRYRRSITFTWLNSLASQVAFYGVSLWGPTLVVLQLGVTPARAAFLFIFVSLAGFLARIVAAFASDRFGRRRTGLVGTIGATVSLVAVVLLQDVTVGPVALFFPTLLVASAFLDGTFSVGLPYWSELFPTDLRASGVGAAYGFGGIGKVLGPAALALISGAGTVVTPKATSAAIGPAFLFFAAFTLIAAGSYAWLAMETKGMTLAEIDAELETQARRSGAKGRRSAAGVPEVAVAAAPVDVGRGQLPAAQLKDDSPVPQKVH